MIKLLADRNLYKLDQFLPAEIDCTLYDPQSEIPNLEGFDAWLLRTVTKVNQQTFPDLESSMKFVGTASSGSDHVDIPYLNSKDIHFVDALGCNARAVAEYVMTALLLWMEKRYKNLSELTFGIIGVGKAGGAVADLFSEFGLKTVLYDTPRAELDPSFTSASLEEVLDCDVLTFHVPFDDTTPHATYHWLDEEKLANRNYELVINAARGGVIDETAVSKAMDSGTVKDIIIDVWENEPDFDPEFMGRAFIATPHIAGYSEQAKLNATKMVCDQLCDFFGLKCPSAETLFSITGIEFSLNGSLATSLNKLHPIMEYDEQLRSIASHAEKKKLFAKLRTVRPFRNEYGYLRLLNVTSDLPNELVKLGLQK